MKDMKSAFVLDLPSGQERLICRNCVFIAPLEPITRPFLEECTPVTLTCEAKCSKCGEEI
jgi:hypothetical protein